MKEKTKLSLKRVFMFAIIIFLVCISTNHLDSQKDILLAIEDTPYYEGKYNSINFVANILDDIDKDNILISPFNINSTLAGLYNKDVGLSSYFQDTSDNVNNNYLSKMTKYKKSIKKKSKKESFYEKIIQDFYTKHYDMVTIKSLNKMGNIEKKELITILDTILLSEESLSNKNISLKQLEKYKPRETDYNINNQSIMNKINTIIWDYSLYTKKNYINNITNLYYNPKYSNISLNYLEEKYLLKVQAINFANIEQINSDLYIDSNKQVNYIVDETDSLSDSLITSSFVFNYKWEEIIESTKNTYDDFYIDDTSISVEMLNFTSTNYLENSAAKGFIKDYENNKYSFVGILPKYDNNLSSINLENLLSNKKDININISIPKFSLTDFNNIMDLKRVNSINLQQDTSILNLDKYYQKNTFSFQEAGTYHLDSKVIIGSNIATLSTVENIVFNHPFYFMVIDNDNNSILLAGKITNPNL